MRKKDVYTVFNLDVGSEVNFSFDVALGAVMTDDPRPGGPTELHSLDEQITCQVFIHDRIERKRRNTKLLLKELEIGVMVVPAIDWGRVKFECQRQLSLVLRLFKSDPFWITTWERRSEVRPWPLPSAAYRLQEEELSRFCDFSKKLLWFHAQRGLYHLFRFGFPQFITEPLAPADPRGRKFLAENAQIMIAADLFEQAHGNWWLSDKLRLILLVTAAEALFGDDDKAELAYRLSHRVAVLNGSQRDERRKIFQLVQKLYRQRSQLVHGSVYRGKEFITIEPAELITFSDLVRSSLLDFIFFVMTQKLDKANILQTLDNGVFDDTAVLELHEKANEHWGLVNLPAKILES